jgi:hypothetical protein
VRPELEEQEIAFDLSGSWQVRALREAKGQTITALESVLEHTYEHVLLIMIEAAFPFRPRPIEPSLPCIASTVKVDKTGAIVADVIDRDHRVHKDVVIYRSETEMQNDFRRLADRLKLSDAERIEMFKCVQRWVVADRRLDPNFDPRDPDAKRLVVH